MDYPARNGFIFPAVFIGWLIEAPPIPLTKVKEQNRFFFKECWDVPASEEQNLCHRAGLFSSRLLVKSVKDLRAEATQYDELLK